MYLIDMSDIPEGSQPFTMAAVGYIGGPEQLPDDLALKEYGE
jgi:hypothetical protein